MSSVMFARLSCRTGSLPCRQQQQQPRLMGGTLHACTVLSEKNDAVDCHTSIPFGQSLWQSDRRSSSSLCVPLFLPLTSALSLCPSLAATAPHRLPYSYLVGGVFAISKDHLIQVNGYSNLYWGWGAEDDDMSHR